MNTRPSDRITDEQVALRRVAMLVAGGAASEEVFSAVATEAGRLLEADLAVLVRSEPPDITIVGMWTPSAAVEPPAIGSRLRLGGRNATTLVCRTGRPAWVEYGEATGEIGDVAVRYKLHASLAVPINVEGRLWGVMTVGFTRQRPLPVDAEARLAGFTELVATAIANAQARVELRSFAEEQAALRRVAMLVAGGMPAERVFAAVTAETGRLLRAEASTMCRYNPDNTATVVAGWSRSGSSGPAVQVGGRVEFGGRDQRTVVFRTRRPARIDDAMLAGLGLDRDGDGTARAAGRPAVGVPISVEGGLWGVIGVRSRREEPLPADTEARLTAFTELVATAIANVQARTEMRGFAEEQAALRRVATLVARAARPQEVFGAVAEEAGLLLRADHTVLSRYDAEGHATIEGTWIRPGLDRPFTVGHRFPATGRNVHADVLETCRPARVDNFDEAWGPGADLGRAAGAVSSVGVPIMVQGHLWGVMLVSSRAKRMPTQTEAWLTGFTELIGTAIANAQAQAALAASRARIVATADITRRRIERNLHDGAQQRLVCLALQLRIARAAVPPGAGELAEQLDEMGQELTAVLDELREIARGIHPAILAEGGLGPALRALARRCAVPVRLDVRTDARFAEPIEVAAYYVVSEALTNAVKHATATVIAVEVEADDTTLRVRVRDDGRGGADAKHGSGLVGLQDRVEALGGGLTFRSPPGVGTTVEISLPRAMPA